MRGEVVRKALHLLIALVPSLASLSVPFTLALLAFGTLFYALAETSRRHGHPVIAGEPAHASSPRAPPTATGSCSARSPWGSARWCR